MNLFSDVGASLWGPFKELWETVDAAVLKRQPETVHLLDLQLKKHKPHFLSLFKNPVRKLAYFPAFVLALFVNIHHIFLLILCNIFSQRVRSRERKFAEPAQKASQFKASRVHVFFLNNS